MAKISIIKMSNKSQNDKQEIEALKMIQKRATKLETNHYNSFKTASINPMDNFFERHYKSLAFVAVETCHNTFFHFIDTVKVRG